jgi:tetratricopeptide (TPR) repeat protein
MKPAFERLGRAVAAPGSPWPWIAVVLLAFLPNAGILGNPFALDDWDQIVNNRFMVHPQPIREIFTNNAWGFRGRVGQSNFYRPLQHVANWAIYHAAGPRPAWFHLFSLLLHVAATLMVALLVSRLSGSRPAGLLAGALFGPHPLHTEVVAWIASTPELICSVFLLAALLLYLRLEGASGWKRAALTAAVSLSLLLAMLGKEMAVLLLPIVAACEWMVRRRGMRAQIRERWPEYAAMGAVTAFYLWVRLRVLGSWFPVQPKTAYTWLDRVWTGLALFYRYLLYLFWPGRLSVFRDDTPNASPWDPAVLAGVLCLLVAIALGAWLYRRRRPEAFAIPLYILLLAPVFSLPYLLVHWIFLERSAYLPSIAFCWLAAVGLIALAKWRGAGSAGLIVAVVLAGYSVRTAVRVRDWSDEVKLIEQAVNAAPRSFYLQMYYGEVNLRHGRPVVAAAALREAVRLRGDYADGHNMLGQAYLQLNLPQLALRHYSRAADLCLAQGQPYSAARAWNNIAILCRLIGRREEAIAAYRRALQLDPTFAVARNNLGFALLLEGRVDEAIAELESAVLRDPALGLAYSNLGLAYATAGRPEEADAALRHAERLMPDNGDVQARIGELELSRGRKEEAWRRFQRALQLDPGNPRAQAGLAALQPATPQR